MPSEIETLYNNFLVAIQKKEQTYINALNKQYDVAYQGIRAKIDEILYKYESSGRISPNQLRKLRQYQELIQTIQKSYPSFGNYYQDFLNEYMQDFSKLGVEQSYDMLGGISDVFELNLVPQRLSTQALNNFATLQTRELLGLLPSSLEKILDKRVGLYTSFVLESITKGLAVGANPRIIARKISDFTKADKKYWELLARDQMIRSHRNGTIQGFQKNGIKQYKRLAPKNERTCLACLALDGKIFESAEMMPLHPQDRCTLIPVIKGIKPKTQSGEEYFNSLPEEKQRLMMGDERYEMYKNGEFSFEQLADVYDNPVWGKSVRVSSIERLKTNPKPIVIDTPKPKRGRPVGSKNKPKPEPIPDKITGEMKRKEILKIQENATKRYKEITDEIEEIRIKENKLWERLDAGDESVEGLIQSLFERKTALRDEQTSLFDRRNDAIRESLLKNTKCGLKFSISNSKNESFRKDEIIKGTEFVQRFIGDNPRYNNLSVAFKYESSGRSYYDNAGTIFMAANRNGSIVAHEIGHFLEHSDKEHFSTAIAFLERRTDGEVTLRLRDLYPNHGYSASEIVKPDQFISEYMGKIYKSQDAYYGTEITSMGLEFMYKNPVEFAEKDPDYFDFIWELFND